MTEEKINPNANEITNHGFSDDTDKQPSIMVPWMI